MRGLVFLLHFIFIKWFLLKINAEEENFTFPIIISNDTDDENFNKKSILRYGHHRTHKCQNFKKTYICVHECLKRKYDIASADENCKCTCFYDKVKAKYYGNKDGWKMPTTKIPAAWAKDHSEQNQEDEDISVDEKDIINVANVTEKLKLNVYSTEAVDNSTEAEYDTHQGNDNETDYTNETSDEQSQNTTVEDSQDISAPENASSEGPPAEDASVVEESPSEGPPAEDSSVVEESPSEGPPEEDASVEE